MHIRFLFSSLKFCVVKLVFPSLQNYIVILLSSNQMPFETCACLQYRFLIASVFVPRIWVTILFRAPVLHPSRLLQEFNRASANELSPEHVSVITLTATLNLHSYFLQTVSFKAISTIALLPIDTATVPRFANQLWKWAKLLAHACRIGSRHQHQNSCSVRTHHLPLLTMRLSF